MKKILIVTWNFPPKVGGIENLVWDIYQCLARHYDVDVLTAGEKSQPDEKSIYRITSGNPYRFLVGSFLWILHRRYLSRSCKYDLIVSGSILVSASTVPAGIFTSTPVVSVSHGMDMTYHSSLWRLFLKVTLPLNRRVIVNSDQTRANAISRGLPENKAFTIHPGIPQRYVEVVEQVEAGNDARERMGLGKKPMLLSVGRLTRRKGLHPFVRNVMPQLVKTFPEIVLVIVGDDPDQALVKEVRERGERKLIEQAACELGLQKNIVLLGNLTDEKEIVELYHAADIFVFPVVHIPHDQEGFGMVAVEASLTATPVVATRTGGIPDSVEDGVSGILIDPGDYENFAEQIKMLLKDEQAIHKLGTQGQERARAFFTWSYLCRKWVDLVELATK